MNRTPREPVAQTRLRVNPIACTAFGFCAEYAPELFALDEWGYAWPHQPEVPAGLEDLARDAAARCPRRAILLQTSSTPPSGAAPRRA